MEPQQHVGNVFHRIAEGTPADALDVFGPTVEFLRRPGDADADFCVMRGVVPPGVIAGVMRMGVTPCAMVGPC